MSKTKIYLLPYWATDALTRQKLDASAILDFSTMRQALSVNDLAGVLATAKLADYLIGKKNIDFDTNISYEWSVSATPQDKSFLYDQIDPLSLDESVAEMVRARLCFTEDFTQEAGSDKRVFADASEKPYTVLHLSNNALAVVLKAHGFTPSLVRKYQLAMIRDILQQLYVYESPPEVAKNPLTLRYLELLLGTHH